MKAQKTLVLFLAMALVVFGFAAMAQAAQPSYDTQTVTIEVKAIRAISVSGPVSLTIDTAIAGQEPGDVSDASTTYFITTNKQDQKITASIDSPMPQGTHLKVKLGAPGVGNSQGDVTLADEGIGYEVVTGISKVAGNGTITYTFSVDGVAVGEVPSTDRMVTFTLMD